MTLVELITALELLRDNTGVDPNVPVMIDGGQGGRGPGLSELTDVDYPYAVREVWLS